MTIDVDHFKKYIDRYGHAQGDAALRAVSDVIAPPAARHHCPLRRLGIRRRLVSPVAAGVAAHGRGVLTRAVVALNFAHADSAIGKLSISVGVAMLMPAGGQSSADLLKAADNALYEAKRQGRNRVVVASSDCSGCRCPKKPSNLSKYFNKRESMLSPRCACRMWLAYSRWNASIATSSLSTGSAHKLGKGWHHYHRQCERPHVAATSQRGSAMAVPYPHSSQWPT